MRALLRRLRGQEAGFTFVEVIASVVILGIIMVPLGTAMVFAYRTVFGIQDRLANSADVQRLSTYFPSDVASVDADGVNPARVEDENICKATATEQSLITFRWDEDLGDGGQTVVRYVATGSGKDSKVVRRICRGSDAPVETVLAKNFGEGTGAPEASTYLTDPDHPDLPPTPVCGTTSCYIDIHGAYTFHLEAQRRVEGDDGSNSPPGAPTNVHALGGFERARLYWLDPVDTGGLPITGYYIEQTGNGATSIVGGATPTFYPPGSGTTGAVIPNLTNGSSYVFRVRAVTAVGNGPWSENSNSVTPGPTTPEPPSLDSAAGDPATNGRITGSWSLASDYSDGGSALTGFKLTALSPDATPTTVTYGDSNARNGAVTGLTDNTKYKVEVTATNSYGEGSPSPVPITVLTRPGAPGTPTAGPTGVAGSVTLSFTLPTGGDVADLTNVRAKIGSTFSDPVAVPTACPDHQNCTITVTGVNVSSATTITVEAQNATGWGPDSGALVVPADTSPPTVAISFPSNPQYGTASWNAGCSNSGGAICGTASDNVPGAVANVTVTVKRSDNNRYWNGNPGTSNTQWPSTNPIILTATGTTSWQQALTTASLVNGVTYTITAQAKDTVNLPSTVVTRTFGYVTGAPTATLTAPANNANVSGSTTVSGNAGATSPATVASAEFQYAPHNSGTWTSIGVVTASPYTTSWDTTAIPDGSYDLRMIVTDSAGNTTISSTRTVTIDNNPPTGSITAPANGAYVHGNAVSVTADSADAGSGVGERGLPVQADGRGDLDPDRRDRHLEPVCRLVEHDGAGGRVVRPAGHHDRQRGAAVHLAGHLGAVGQHQPDDRGARGHRDAREQRLVHEQCQRHLAGTNRFGRHRVDDRMRPDRHHQRHHRNAADLLGDRQRRKHGLEFGHHQARRVAAVRVADQPERRRPGHGQRQRDVELCRRHVWRRERDVPVLAGRREHVDHDRSTGHLVSVRRDLEHLRPGRRQLRPACDHDQQRGNPIHVVGHHRLPGPDAADGHDHLPGRRRRVQRHDVRTRAARPTRSAEPRPTRRRELSPASP